MVSQQNLEGNGAEVAKYIRVSREFVEYMFSFTYNNIYETIDAQTKSSFLIKWNSAENLQN